MITRRIIINYVELFNDLFSYTLHAILYSINSTDFLFNL